MSQQKIMLALCLVAGVCAMASAQSLNYQTCSRAVRDEIDRYRENLMSGAQKFTNGLQQTGSQATDMSAFQEDIDKLTNSWQSLASGMSQGFDMGKFTSTYVDNMSTIASLMAKSFRASLVSGTMENYMQMGQTVFSANSQFLSVITEKCMPQRMRRVQPANQA